MNPYYYLFYKLSRFLNRKGRNEMGPIYAVTAIILMNIVIVYVKLFQITEGNSKGYLKVILGAIIIFLFVANIVLFQNKLRVKNIMERYGGESKRRRQIGSFLVILYVVLSLGLIVFL